MLQEFRHRRPLALLLPFLVLAILVPLLIARCGMSRASARPLGASPAWPQPTILPVPPAPAPLPPLPPITPPTPRPIARVLPPLTPPAALTVSSAPAAAAPSPLPTINLERIRLAGDRYVTQADDGGEVELTLDPALQLRAEEVLRRSGAVHGAAVFVSIPDGRILAMTGRSLIEPQRSVADLTLRPWAPAASVFKVVTSAALLDGRQVTPDRRVCYHGGASRLMRDNLEDRPRLDRRCGDLAHAVGFSTNSIIAKLAHRYLDPRTLERYADAFGFNQGLQRSAAFPLEVAASPAVMPREDLEFARTAAGFWHVFLSPLHGARLASAFANAGLMVGPRLVERVRGTDGRIREPPVPPPTRAISAKVAREVGRMMLGTTRFGTARGTFARRRLPFEVAGKTGSLSRPRPYTHYNWFVGFAPADSPRIAFGVIVGTDGRGVRAAEIAREVLREAPSRSTATLVATK